MTRPNSSGPTRKEGLAPQVMIWSPKRTPWGRSSVIESTFEPRKPTISPGKLLPPEDTISQDSPTEQNGPADSTRLPTTWVTRPFQRMVEHVGSQFWQDSIAFILVPVFERADRRSHALVL